MNNDVSRDIVCKQNESRNSTACQPGVFYCVCGSGFVWHDVTYLRAFQLKIIAKTGTSCCTVATCCDLVQFELLRSTPRLGYFAALTERSVNESSARGGDRNTAVIKSVDALLNLISNHSHDNHIRSGLRLAIVVMFTDGSVVIKGLVCNPKLPSACIDSCWGSLMCWSRCWVTMHCLFVMLL